MIVNECPIRKGEIFVVQARKSQTNIAMKTDVRIVWELAICLSSTRNGFVKKYRRAGISSTEDAKTHSMFFSIGTERQKQARHMFDQIQFPGFEFEKIEDLKAEILRI